MGAAGTSIVRLDCPLFDRTLLPVMLMLDFEKVALEEYEQRFRVGNADEVRLFSA